MKVKEVLKVLQNFGWTIVRIRGSHRQLKHPTNPGTVTIAGKESLEIPKGTLKSISKQSGIEL